MSFVIPRLGVDVDTFFVGLPKREALNRLATFQERIKSMAPADRAVYMSLFGAQKCGTTALSSYLSQHPFVVGPKSTFFHYRFDDYVKSKGRGTNRSTSIVVDAARAAVVDYFFPVELKANASVVAIDNWPDNLFRSVEIAPRVHRTCPLAKIVVMLRDPVERAYSEYFMERGRKRDVRKMTFEEFIQPDIQLLKKLGVIPEDGRHRFPMNCQSGRQELRAENITAWVKYLRSPRAKYHPIGRGLYSIQLQHLFKEYGLVDVPGERNANIAVYEYKRLYQNGSQAAFDQVVDFLGLPEHTLKSSDHVRVGKYSQSMENTTKQMLQNLFAPFNCQLPSILRDKAW
eukprot:CAMPEP_0113563658 /NCGR_PEP_ID=MMETSP0015_2-20120614/21189_1 /TAXON_ID=2838 /ORGANISM="Odontella" /LENGTH=343 /DNA_ID=CAMNT_0000465659 /DNA_START=211 /DNA_END=1239 /DNA_ORIENTATION=- /assembly_acc=CAM_ASM_000160